MLFLASNIKALRRDQQLSQEVLSGKLHISRASLAKYEGGINEPSLDVIVRMSRYFNISIDVLLTVDLGKVKLGSVGRDNLGFQSVIIPIQVNASGDHVIEVVPHSAQAGYTGNYSDPGFIETLDQMALPFQELHGNCRAFPIEGDSMPPFIDGCYVIGRQVLSRNEVLDNKRYVIVSRDEGIVFKRIFRDKTDSRMLKLHSDNPKYKVYQMPFHEIVEMWEFVAAISFAASSENYFASEVLMKVKELQENIQKLVSDLAPETTA